MSFFRRAGAAIARIFESSADPAAEANKVLLYSKDAAGVSQLFARSDDGTVHQVTPAAGGAPSSVFVWQAGVPWATIYTQMVAVTGPKICLVAFDPAAPGGERQITNNGGAPQFISDIYFWALSGPLQSINVFVRIQDGFVLGGVTETGGRVVGRLMSRDIGWDIRNTGGAVIFTPAGTGYAEFQLDGGYITNSNPLVVGKVLAFLRNRAELQGGSANGMFRPIANGSYIEMRTDGRTTGVIFNSVGGPFNVTLDIDPTATVSATMFTNATRVLQRMNNIVRDVGTGQRYAITVVAGVLTITPVN